MKITMMKTGLLFLASFLCIILQETVFNFLSVAGGKPDFTLIFVVFAAIFRGSIRGGIYGLCIGFMEDLMVGRFLGINAICKGLIGYIVGSVEKNLYKDNFIVPAMALVVATVVNSLIYYVVCHLIGSSILWRNLVGVTIPDAIYNMCFAPAIYAVFYYVHNMKTREYET